MAYKPQAIALPETIGTAFPTSPEDGQAYYRTDHEELYHYDGTRSKWLGELQTIQINRNTSTSSGALSLFYGVTYMTSTKGLTFGTDMTIVGVDTRSNQAFSAPLELFIGGSKDGNIVTYSSSKGGSDRTIDYDIDENTTTQQWFRIGTITSGTIDNPQIRIFLRRRAT